jgi:S-formylglutathione hydrolase FrmB
MLAALFLAATLTDASKLSDQLEAVLTRWLAGETILTKRLGDGIRVDLGARLSEDRDLVAQDPWPGYDSEGWSDRVHVLVQIDSSAIDGALSDSPPALDPRPGLREVFVRSKVDGTLQPAALYVPSPRTEKPYALAVVLHGNPQTESSLLASPDLRRMADETGTILLAPWGRGNYDFAAPADTELYDLTSEALDVLPVDRHRVYLVGYSMGGFTVYMVGPRRDAPWTGIMSISGAMLNSEIAAIQRYWGKMHVYVVCGAHDDSIPTRYGEQTATYLTRMGVPVSFYEEPSGTHAFRSLAPSLGRAWDDMHAGTVRNNAPSHPGGSESLPGSAPSGPMHPT